MKLFTCAALAGYAVAQINLDYRGNYGSLFSELGDLSFETDPINPDGGVHSHSPGQTVAHIDLAMACIDETQDMDADISALSTKCGTVKTDADSLTTNVTSLTTELNTIKTTISSNAELLAGLKAQNAGQDSLITGLETNIADLEAMMLQLEIESSTFNAYLISLDNLYSDLDGFMTTVEADQATNGFSSSPGDELANQQTNTQILQQTMSGIAVDKDSLLNRIAAFSPQIDALETGIVAEQATSAATLGTDYTALTDAFFPLQIRADYFTTNAAQEDFANLGANDLTGGEFCVEPDMMIEFYLAATTQPGDSIENVTEFSLEVGGTTIARSTFVPFDQRGRSFTLFYKGYTGLGDKTYKIVATTAVSSGTTPDTTRPSAMELNIQWGVRQYSGDYVLNTTGPINTCSA